MNTLLRTQSVEVGDEWLEQVLRLLKPYTPQHLLTAPYALHY
jgi:hypothetical protein